MSWFISNPISAAKSDTPQPVAREGMPAGKCRSRAPTEEASRSDGSTGAQRGTHRP
jgi:hypothetical protein